MIRPPTSLLTTAALATFAALFSAAPARAADEPLTLVQALKRAVEGNTELKQERLAVDLIDAQLLTAQGRFDFVFSAGATFQRRTTPPLSAEDIGGGFTNGLTLDAGITKPLETGGSVRLSAIQRGTNSNSRFSCGTVFGGGAQTCTFYGDDLSLSLSHPLLRGFGAEITQANIRRQRVQRDVALMQRQTRASNVLRDVITTYWELAYATRDLFIRQSAVDLAREQLRVTQAQIEVGRLAPIDSAAVERAIGERMQDVAVSEQNLFFRTLELRRLFGMPSDPSLPVFAASEVPAATAREIEMVGEIQRALESNPQLRSVKMGLKLSEIDIQTAQATMRPQLDFVGAIGATGRKRVFSEAVAQTYGLDDLTWSAGLDLQIPIENRIARGQVRAAQLGAQRTRLDAGDFELTLRDQVMRLATMVRTAGKRVELTRATVGYAEKNLEAEKARFSVGRSTNNEVLLRQQELKNAEISVVRATVDLLNSEAALAAITGDLLDRYGIVLKGS